MGFETISAFAANLLTPPYPELDKRVRKEWSQIRVATEQRGAAKSDLAKPEGVEELYRVIRDTGRPVDAIALNAGVGAGGDFVRETSLDADFNVIDLNIKSTGHLGKRTRPGTLHLLDCGDNARYIQCRL